MNYCEMEGRSDYGESNEFCPVCGKKQRITSIHSMGAAYSCGDHYDFEFYTWDYGEKVTETINGETKVTESRYV